MSRTKYPEDAKIAAILLGLPTTLRTHLQMQITESTTYEGLKDKIIHYESVTTKWDSTNSLQMPNKMASMADEAVPMEVDVVSKGKKGKGKSKKGSKGKGKTSKGKYEERSKGWKGNKGKDDHQKGKGQYKGKTDEKGKGKADRGCFNCGKKGHVAKECWAPKKVQQVEDGGQGSTQAGGASASSDTRTSSRQETHVRMVRLVTPPDALVTEMYDLTADEADNGPSNGSYSVCMVKRALEEEADEFKDCFEEAETWTPSGVSIVALHLQDGDSEDEEDDGLHREALEDKFTRMNMALNDGPAASRPDEGADGSDGPAKSRPSCEKCEGPANSRPLDYVSDGPAMSRPDEEDGGFHIHLEEDERKDGACYRVCMVKKRPEANPWHEVTLDSGADLSVLPMKFAGIGLRRPDRKVVMIDAQGREIESSGTTKATLTVSCDDGRTVQISEEFALGRVKQPLLCAGKFLRRGWNIKQEDSGLCLSNPEGNTRIPLELKRESIQMKAKIMMISIGPDDQERVQQRENVKSYMRADKRRRYNRGEEVSETEEGSTSDAENPAKMVRALEGYLSKELKMIEKTPGWHRLPNGVAVYSDSVARHFLDPRGMLSDHWKSRLTLMKMPESEGMWRQVENLENMYEELDAFRSLTPNDDSQRVLTFLAPTKFLNYYEENSEVPVAPYPRVLESRVDIRWDDEDEEDGEQATDDALYAEEYHAMEYEDQQEVTIDNEKFTMEMSAKQLREACLKHNLATSGSKKKLMLRLETYRVRLQMLMESDLAKKLYEEQMRRPVQIKPPKLPSQEEQDEHNLTHWPMATWCEACLATRSREDHHQQQEHSHGKPVIQFDYCYTFTDEKGDQVVWDPNGSTKFPSDQFGTMLVAAASETKAVLAIPIAAKGSMSLKMVTEELVRFGLHNSSQDGEIIYQADGERSCKQVLKAVQQTRARMNLKTEIRESGKGQHQSNGQAERAVQNIRNLGNCIRKHCEERARHHVGGTSEVYPWSFRHAAWLINRYRVVKPHQLTSYEMMYGRRYKGNICQFGENVLFKSMTPWKGDDVFHRGVWVGKSHWNDNHILMTANGVVEARSIRRLTDQFNSFSIHFARGLPWSYTGMGVLMKHGGTKKRPAIPVLDATEEDIMNASKQIAMGLMTPAILDDKPGSQTPGLAAPGTPMAEAAEKGQKRDDRDETEEPDEKRQKVESSHKSSSSSSSSNSTEEDDVEKMIGRDRGQSSKKARTEEPRPDEGMGISVSDASGSRSKRPAELQTMGEASPKTPKKLYSPSYAGDIRRIEHGDEEEFSPLDCVEEGTEMKNEGFEGDDEGHPPEVSPEELAALDDMAEEEEIERLLKMPVLKPLSAEEGQEYNVISSKLVTVWKYRQEKNGWFRRARLVARQFKNSIAFEEFSTFAPTSASIIPRLFVYMLLNVFSSWEIRLVDIEDAFLMAKQPEDEKNAVSYRGKLYGLLKCLPGQRTAARCWYELFKETVMKYGGKTNALQPTLFKLKDLMISVHVDDLIMLGSRDASIKFLDYLQKELQWKLDIEGPYHQIGDEFMYLKRKYSICHDGIVIRPDQKHIEELAKMTGVEGKKPKKVPCRTDISEIDNSPEVDRGETTEYRSCVGKLLYIAGERPDCQFGIHSLAKRMAKPTMKSWSHVQQMASYLTGTMKYGIKIKFTKKGKSILDRRDPEDVEDKGYHLLEVITDADHGGCKESRKSLTSYQLYLDGCLIESKVRSQKSIALSSGESEFVAIVGGASEAFFTKQIAEFLLGALVRIRSRSDSSAARAMCNRQGIGRVRHLGCGMLWIQDRVQKRDMEVSPIPTAVNPADLGTKPLGKARTLALMHLTGMVDENDLEVGQPEFEQVEEKMNLQKSVKKISGAIGRGSKFGMAAIIALCTMMGARAVEHDDPDTADRWLDWVLYSTVALNSLGALGLAMGMWITMKWFMGEKRPVTTKEEEIQANEAHVKQEELIHELYERTAYMDEQLQQKDDLIKHLELMIENLRYQIQLDNDGRPTEGERKHAERISLMPSGKAYHFNRQCEWFPKGKWYNACAICRKLEQQSHEGSVSSNQSNSVRQS